MNENEFRELSAGRALGALSTADERAFTEALSAHPEWQAIADHDTETTAMLTAATPDVAPPPELRSRLLDSINQMPQGAWEPNPSHSAESTDETGTDHDTQIQRSRASRGRRIGAFALAASVIVLLAVTFTPRIWESLAPQDPITIALEQVETAPDARSETVALTGEGNATLHWSDSEAQAVLVANDMPELPDDRDFELWLVRGETPISLGVMRANEDHGGTVIAEGFEPGDVVAVTVEAHGGSASGAPTSDPIFAVSTA